MLRAQPTDPRPRRRATRSTLGVAFWAGIGMILLLIPLSSVLSSFMVRLQRTLMSAKDVRVQRVSEALAAMKLIKSSAWEPVFAARIRAAREAELRRLRDLVLVDMTTGVMWEAVPLSVAVVSFLVFSATGGTLTATAVFTSLALFDLVKFPLLVFPDLISQARARGAARRVRESGRLSASAPLGRRWPRWRCRCGACKPSWRPRSCRPRRAGCAPRRRRAARARASRWRMRRWRGARRRTRWCAA